MKKIIPAALALVLLPSLCLAADKREIKSEADRINYSIGYQVGGDFQRQGWKLDPDLLLQGILDAQAEGEPRISRTEMNATLSALKRRLTAAQKEEAKRAGGAFLAGNARRADVTVLPSGVQYRVIRKGTGKRPALDDLVTVRYRVERADGLAGANSSEGKPKTYPLKKALPGLQEVLQLMEEGSVWQVVLPPGPPLGSRGEPLEGVGVLIYELELVSVQPGG